MGFLLESSSLLDTMLWFRNFGGQLRKEDNEKKSSNQYLSGMSGSNASN